MTVLGILGGSGVYDMAASRTRNVADRLAVRGDSDEFLFGVLDDLRLDVVFVPRQRARPPTFPQLDQLPRQHRCPEAGRRHRHPVALGLRLAARGPAAGHFVIVDQFIDRTSPVRRASSARAWSPTSPWPTHLQPTGRARARVRPEGRLPGAHGGTYLAMEGPQFSSLAESRLYRSWGCDVIGMTKCPRPSSHAKLEICYVTVAMVTDFDCWHPDHDHVQVPTSSGCCSRMPRGPRRWSP